MPEPNFLAQIRFGTRGWDPTAMRVQFRHCSVSVEMMDAWA